MSGQEILAGPSNPAVTRNAREVDYILGTVQELVEFSHGQHGTLKRQTCSVTEFIERVIAILEARFAKQHITIEQQLNYTGAIHVDIEKMTRAFVNIAENAQRMYQQEEDYLWQLAFLIMSSTLN